MATVRKPSSVAARKTRIAISLRFAKSNFCGALGAAAAGFVAAGNRALPADGLIWSRGYKHEFKESKAAIRFPGLINQIVKAISWHTVTAWHSRWQKRMRLSLSEC